MKHSIKGYITDRRILPLIIIVVALALLDWHFGVHFGIEFIGGTQIPVTLEHSVNVTTMSSLISALQQRVSTFGLKQVTVEGIGTSHVYVTVPTVSSSEINQTISIIESQGRFQGIVNGKEALNGSGIIKGSIGPLQPTVSNGTVTWMVTFYLTTPATSKFTRVVLGQANQPLYMFLDRPEGAVIIINQSSLGDSTLGINNQQAMSAMQSALQLGNQTIPVIAVSGSNSSIGSAESFLRSNAGRYKTAIIQEGLGQGIISAANSSNYTIKVESRANMTPQYTKLTVNQSIVQSWPIVGLLSSPVLSPSVTNGSSATSSYEISGVAPPTGNLASREAYATNQTKTIASILNGGALPVAIIAGTPTTIPPTLGREFLYVSGIAGAIAIALVSLFIVIRYRKLFLIAPILMTTVVELFIIVSIIGLIGTIDLSAVAGMIAVIGTGMDAQIIITDEMLGKGEGGSAKTVLGHAFYIIWADAILLVIAMLPLFFSTSLVTVVGFSESTIIGAFLGVLITRPAYSAILSRHYAE